MRFKELKEWSEFMPGITGHLTKLGYKKLGQGADQQAWEDPSDPNVVLKIFGTRKFSTGLTPDHEMLYLWAKFCEENSNNPYLPKFYGIETFEHKGHTYLQFRQEKLYKNSKFTTELTQSLVLAIKRKNSFTNWMIFINSLAGTNYGHYKEMGKMLSDGEQIKQLRNFYETLNALYSISKNHGWEFDVHEENIMMRADTTPVISDPWVL